MKKILNHSTIASLIILTFAYNTNGKFIAYHHLEKSLFQDKTTIAGTCWSVELQDWVRCPSIAIATITPQASQTDYLALSQDGRI
ncbi:hypothetical protein ACEYW6_33705 [Nostoc sp. UIC 10607]|uniref:hypothetical protein n=1 Tax=Nostoc sp. UIC 10607 TaxID=3045935 RepID=UPI0039A1F441